LPPNCWHKQRTFNLKHNFYNLCTNLTVFVIISP
jgi:hypothetical protein